VSARRGTSSADTRTARRPCALHVGRGSRPHGPQELHRQMIRCSLHLQCAQRRGEEPAARQWAARPVEWGQRQRQARRLLPLCVDRSAPEQHSSRLWFVCWLAVAARAVARAECDSRSGSSRYGEISPNSWTGTYWLIGRGPVAGRGQWGTMQGRTIAVLASSFPLPSLLTSAAWFSHSI